MGGTVFVEFEPTVEERRAGTITKQHQPQMLAAASEDAGIPCIINAGFDAPYSPLHFLLL